MVAGTALRQRVPSYADVTVSEKTKQRLEQLVYPHVESFNYFLTSGILEAVKDLPPFEFMIDGTLSAKMTFTEAQIGFPTKFESFSDNRLTPREARERGMSYGGALVASVHIELSDGSSFNMATRCGDVPIMVMSEKCHLYGLGVNELVDLREESNELGGYFIVNGIERVVRLLQVPRRNHAMAIERSSFKKRGPSYSDKGVMMRCVRPDQSSVTLTLHFLNNGGATLRFTLRKQEFLLPVVFVAKAMFNITDKELFDRIVQGDVANTFLTTRLELLLRDAKQLNAFSQVECCSYLGSHFRQFLPISDQVNDELAGRLLIERFLFVHTPNFGEKLECLIHMIRKLFSFAQNKCAPDNPDAFMNHEILMPGHLFTMYVKEKLDDVFLSVRQNISKDYRANSSKCLLEAKSQKYFQKLFDRFASSIGSKLSAFLSTGNIVSSSGLDLMQVSGFTIVAERLNMLRYMSHFQSVHRGQFFTTMKTTTVRKLLPESWGFLCPVHTPDGSPCGLLNHLTKDAVVLAFPTSQRLPPPISRNALAALGRIANISLVGQPDVKYSTKACKSPVEVKRILLSMGVVASGLGGSDGMSIVTKDFVPVIYNGIIFGSIHHTHASELATQLRLLKASQNVEYSLDPTMEIAYIPQVDTKSAYAGVYLFTDPGRVVRPVYNLANKIVEWIGPMEQVFMDIACTKHDIQNYTTHLELTPSTMLSQVASLTPFSDYNQSPRSIYQCQMGKQTMGTPTHAWKHRSDNKLFRIQNVQAPLVQTKAHADYCMDEYPQGANAVVAVISFTGYDMEDAMIISKSSFERGFGHGSVYKTHTYDLNEEERHSIRDGVRPSYKFSNQKVVKLENGEQRYELYYDHLDIDGLPGEGQLIEYGEAICSFVNTLTGEIHNIKHKESESAYVDTVRVIGSSNNDESLRKVNITLRFCRNPIIGDKFSSRHGQKGTLSVLWPQQNMPFTESGMTPDVLINPHAFPSRMTIGMLIESMAGKAGALHGVFQDATPFQYNEEKRVIDFVGEQLRASGYSYYGSEPLYNGLTGNVMHADIFIGVVFYQRLRHMVSDKAQVRSTGAVVQVTRQPVKGRKKHGGIRLGEMERDSLLSHGVAFCLQDRLMDCSDKHIAHVCSSCGSMLTVLSRSLTGMPNAIGSKHAKNQYCISCESGSFVKPLHMPYVYRYLTNELAAMGIKLTLNLSEH